MNSDSSLAGDICRVTAHDRSHWKKERAVRLAAAGRYRLLDWEFALGRWPMCVDLGRICRRIYCIVARFECSLRAIAQCYGELTFFTIKQKISCEDRGPYCHECNNTRDRQAEILRHNYLSLSRLSATNCGSRAASFVFHLWHNMTKPTPHGLPVESFLMRTNNPIQAKQAWVGHPLPTGQQLG